MPSRAISYDDALKTARGKAAAWQRSLDRLDGFIFPELSPSFSFGAKDSLFTIGSCFARNIEEKLDVLGYDIPVLKFAVPKNEWQARANGILNKFTPPAIWQEIDWAARQFEAGDTFDPELAKVFAITLEDGQVIDSNLQGFVPVTMERFLERRAELYTIFRNLFTAEGLIMTLGLIEAWFDKETGVYIQQMPDRRTFGKATDRFELHVLSYAESLRYIEDSIARVRALNPDVKVMITTSPVPLGRTFASHDVILATMHGKSLLRAVCADVTAKFEHVDYFPSYEAATLTKSWDIWQEDKRHVADHFVGRIVGHLIGGYFPDSAGDTDRLESHSRPEKGNAKDSTAKAYEKLEKGTNPAELAKLLRLLRKNGDPEGLLERLNGLLERFPGDGHLLAVKGEMCAALRMPEAALEAFRAARQSVPLSLSALMDMGRLLITSGELDEAEKIAGEINRLDPDHAGGYILSGRLAFTGRRFSDALAAFDKAVELAPSNPKAAQWRERAEAAVSSGRR